MYQYQIARSNAIVLALAANESTETLPGIESKIQTIQERQINLLRLASAEGVGEQFDEELGKLHEEKTRLMAIREDLLQTAAQRSADGHRLDEIDSALSRTDRGINEYDDVLVRQLISHIKVRDKMTLEVCFQDGTEVVQVV